MQKTIENMRLDELAALRLRRLYESRGFRQVRPGKFDEYQLYLENKNFLQSEQIISFMDMDGKLLALKPDVTLSVVKNIPADPLPTFEKLYYMDEVYRVSTESREYKEYSQIGVELVGPNDSFASIEVVDLALRSLEAISASYVLDISHLGFVSGLLSGLGLSAAAERELLSAIHAKSSHEMDAILEEAGTDVAGRERVQTLVNLHGNIQTALPKAKTLIVNEEMQAAYDELQSVADAMCSNGFSGKLNLDFSVVSNLDYYNGMIFHGYVEGLAHSVLGGGRYDNLLHKMGKASGATGFAVSLDELKRVCRKTRTYDFDLVITYAPDSSWSALLREVQRLTEDGLSVRLEREDADLTQASFTWKRHCRFAQDQLQEKGEEE